MLPPGSASDFTNRGHVTYQVNMNPSLPVGTTLKNRAHIYFDYNSPISTNQTINTLVDPTGIHKQFKGNEVYIYPNPTSGDLSIRADNIEITKFIVYDLVGKKVMVGKLNSNGIETSSLTEGVYFLDLYSEDGQKVTVKFLKAGD
ncbi:MAG: T9SS type A sorting domain-containing protein [Bacteroidota bacterium]|nr:T9SS type A sorting domain-containing protein [Bacteroidota bacterium]